MQLPCGGNLLEPPRRVIGVPDVLRVPIVNGGDAPGGVIGIAYRIRRPPAVIRHRVQPPRGEIIRILGRVDVAVDARARVDNLALHVVLVTRVLSAGLDLGQPSQGIVGVVRKVALAVHDRGHVARSVVCVGEDRAGIVRNGDEPVPKYGKRPLISPKRNCRNHS